MRLHRNCTEGGALRRSLMLLLGLVLMVGTQLQTSGDASAVGVLSPPTPADPEFAHPSQPHIKYRDPDIPIRPRFGTMPVLVILFEFQAVKFQPGHDRSVNLSMAALRLGVFVWGFDGGLWERYWDGTKWTWTSHG